MKRRHFVLQPLILLPALAVGQSAAPSAKVQSVDDVLRWLDALQALPAARTTGDWPLVAVLDHLAQSVEMSMQGYPAPKPEWFQRSLGAAAFGFFKWRGAMTHGLNEPIPGAPALPLQGDWKIGAQRLRQAVLAFRGWQGPLQPHFAYGRLDKADYALAHAFHVANHQDEIRAG